MCFDEYFQVCNVRFLVFLKFLPERATFATAGCVFFIFVLYAPERFVFLGHLLN